MSELGPTTLREGESVESNGVSFEFVPSLPHLATGTTSEPPGFTWDWMLFGRVFDSSSGNPGSFDAGILCGTHAGRFHALTLPETNGAFLYQDIELSSLRVTPKIKKPLLGKPKVVATSIVLTDTFGLAIEVANRLGINGSPDTTNELAAFCSDFGS